MTKAKEFYQTIGKLGTVISVKLAYGNYDEVVQDLKWLHQYLEKFFHLSKNDNKKFLDLFDEERQFKKKEDANFPDLSKIDWGKFKIVNKAGTPTPSSEEFKFKKYRLYDPDLVNIEGPTFFAIILSFSHNIYTIATEINERRIERLSIYIPGNILGYITGLSNSNSQIDQRAVLRSYLQSLINFNSNLLSSENPNDLNFIKYLSINQIFAVYKNDTISVDDFELLLNHFVILIFAETNIKESRLIQHINSSIVDGNFQAKYNSNIYSLDGLFAQNDIKVDRGEFATIYKSLNTVNTPFTLINYQKGLTFLEEKISGYVDKFGLDEPLNQYLNEIKKYYYEGYRYNILQFTVFKILVIALFRKDYKAIKDSINFNQPPDSDATWSNEDVVPTKLFEILNLLNVLNRIEQDLFYIWEGHHGIRPYINNLFLIFFNLYVKSRSYNPNDLKAFISNKIIHDKKPAFFESMKQNFNYFLKLANSYKGRESLLKKEFNLDIDLLVKFFESGKKLAENEIKKIATEADIEEERKVFLISEITKYYYSNSPFISLFKYFNKDHKKSEGIIAIISEDQKFTIGINQYLERTALIEDWHIPRIGLIEFMGKEIITQEEFCFLRLINQANKDERIVKPVKEVQSILDQESKNYDIILSTFNPGYFIEDYKKLKYQYDLDMDDRFKVLKDNHSFLGSYNESLVFNINDPFQKNRLYFINSKHLGSYEYLIDEPEDQEEKYNKNQGFEYIIIDFAKDEKEFKLKYQNPPEWLKQDFGGDVEKIKTHLLKQLWLRIFKKSYWNYDEGLSPKYYEFEE